jgi:hypothetical protein
LNQETLKHFCLASAGKVVQVENGLAAEAFYFNHQN